MRLCFITPEFVTEPSYSGGLANYLGRVSVALAQRGHEVHVFTRADKNGDLEFNGVRVHRVVPRWDQRMILDHVDPLVPKVHYMPYQEVKAAWCLWRRWRQVAARQPFDLVQVANVGAVGLFFGREKRTSVITRMSSYRPVWDRAAAVPETSGLKLRWKLEEWAVKGTRHIYAPTQYVADLVSTNYNLSVRVIESPFFDEEASEDPALWQEHAHDANGNPVPYALFFGRMTQMKGVHVLAQALPAVLRALPDFRLLLVGRDYIAPDGSPMSEYVMRQCDEADPDGTLRARERVKVLGSQRHDLLYPLIRGAHLVILPSLLDNLPNTCLEAMGLGRVVLATSGSCFESLIEDGVSGFLLPPGEVDALANGIQKAWRLSPDQHDQIGRKALERIAQLHPNIAVPRLIEYYQTVIHDFSPQQPRS